MADKQGGASAPPPPSSRSELLARRREESIAQLRAQHESVEASRPRFAPRLTGAAAAAGFRSARVSETEQSSSTTRASLLAARKAQMTEASAAAAGPDGVMAYPPTLTSHLPLRTDEQGMPKMITSLPRHNMKDPSTRWVDNPVHGTRSELVKSRREENIDLLKASANQHALQGRPGVNERVQRRLEESVAHLQRAPPGRSRAEMLLERRSQRVEEIQAAASAIKRAEVALYSSQDRPFWDLTSSPWAAEQRFGDVGASGITSHEEYKSRLKWWAKQEVHSKIGKPPRASEPFKLDPETEKRYLSRKLSSGPKKEMRGYLPQTISLAEKVTNAPAPEIEVKPAMVKVGNELKPRHTARFTDVVNTFRNSEKPSEPSLLLGDGLAMSAPMYSSFQKDGIFREPRLPKRSQTGAQTTGAGPRRSKSPVRCGYASHERDTQPSRDLAGSMRIGGIDYEIGMDTTGSPYGASLAAGAGLSQYALAAAPVPYEQRMSYLLTTKSSLDEPLSARSVRSGGFGSSNIRSRPATRA
eukprot:scaffold21977_cov32-Tisochrysis_lutea.AAC.5